MATNTVARSLHDVGLATWFGGSLMGAVGVNGAAAEVENRTQRARVVRAGWSRWAPVQFAAIAAHGVGAILLTRANRGRLAHQDGVARMAVTKAALTAAALGASAYASVLGQRMDRAGDVPVEGATEPAPETPPEVAGAQRQLRVLQWATPVLTGAVLVVNDVMSEQQRPAEAAKGIFRRLVPGLLILAKQSARPLL